MNACCWLKAMSHYFVRDVREWVLNGTCLPVYVGSGQPHLPIPDVMGLVYESKNSKENTKRFTSYWLEQVKQIHRLMWKGFAVPETYKSFKDGSSQRESLLDKSVMPLSIFMSLLVAASQRSRVEWMERPAKFLVAIINSVCDLGTESIMWQRIGDNTPVTVPLTGRRVDPSLLWTQHACVSWIQPLLFHIDPQRKPWFDDFTLDEPDLAGVLMMCLDPAVQRHQPLLSLLAYSAIAFLADSIARNLHLLTSALVRNTSTIKYFAFKRTSNEETMQNYFATQHKVRTGEVTRI